MAVFPDRIVLKNSTDNQATIEAAIGTGGTDEITQGEIVLGILDTDVRFYTKAGDGSIVSLGGTGTGPQDLGDLADVDLSTPATDGQVIAYNATSGNWEPVDQTGDVTSIIAGTGISVDQSTGDVTITNNVTSISDLTDVDAPTPNNNDILAYNSTSGNWETSAAPPADISGNSIDDLSDVDTLTTPPANDQVLIWNGSNWVPGDQTDTGATSINDLTDVNTSSPPPTNDQVLVWNGVNWVPGDQTGGTGGLAYWGGGDFTTGTSDGQPADGGTFT